MKLAETGKRPVVRWARCEVRSGVIYVIVGVKPEGKTPLRTPRRRWQNNIKIGFLRHDVVVWTRLLRKLY
jgi:hypothetical protein